VKLATVRIGDREAVAVQVTEDSVIEVGNLLELAGDETISTPETMIELIERGDALLDHIAAAGREASEDTLNLRAMTPDGWFPAVRRPRKILGVAMNNSASNERKISAPDHPAFFLKPSSCLIGHREPIRIRRYYGSVHPEPELAVVIGRETRDVEPEDALDAVFGYSIFNDITGNGMRAEDRFHYWAVYADEKDPAKTKRVEQHLSYAARYKGSDSFGVLGPWLVTRDEVENPDDLRVVCSVGGEIVADDSTRYYNFKVAEVISFISRFQTLEAGDVIALGTAFKPGGNRKSIHQANFQTVPGPVVVSIEGLGRQENPVVIEKQPLGRWRLG
jgi:2-keto-4-pentenoate hydratase/2-oxohepta-3-ene-1,7-dioic acid hydratase in catechol pathway